MSDTKIVVATHAARRIPPDQVVALYAEAKWWPERTSPQVAGALEFGPAVGAWSGDRLVGFARAVSDGHFRAYVEDVVVAEEMRGSGIGGRLMKAVMGQLHDIPTVSLFCGADLVDYYKDRGFAATDQTVMHHRA
ncbi:MAG: GNAT family N-acetyltransferase [Stackebrandtia sp.]